MSTATTNGLTYINYFKSPILFISSAISPRSNSSSFSCVWNPSHRRATDLFDSRAWKICRQSAFTVLIALCVMDKGVNPTRIRYVEVYICTSVILTHPHIHTYLSTTIVYRLIRSKRVEKRSWAPNGDDRAAQSLWRQINHYWTRWEYFVPLWTGQKTAW